MAKQTLVIPKSGKETVLSLVISGKRDYITQSQLAAHCKNDQQVADLCKYAKIQGLRVVNQK